MQVFYSHTPFPFSHSTSNEDFLPPSSPFSCSPLPPSTTAYILSVSTLLLSCWSYDSPVISLLPPLLSSAFIFPSFIPSFPALSPVLPSISHSSPFFSFIWQNATPFLSTFYSCFLSFLIFALPLHLFPLFCAFLSLLSLFLLLLSTLYYNDSHNDLLRRQLKDK